MLPTLIFVLTVCLACIFPGLVLIRGMAKERLYAWESRIVQHCKQTWHHEPHFAGWLAFMSIGFIETLYTASTMGDFLQGSGVIQTTMNTCLGYPAAITCLWGAIHCWRQFTADIDKTRSIMPSLCSATLLTTFLSCGLFSNQELDMPTSAEASQNAMYAADISAAAFILWGILGLCRQKTK